MFWGNALFHACLKIVEKGGDECSPMSTTEAKRERERERFVVEGYV